MFVEVLVICLLAKSEILSLICIGIGLLRLLYRIAEEYPKNGI